MILSPNFLNFPLHPVVLSWNTPLLRMYVSEWILLILKRLAVLFAVSFDLGTKPVALGM